MRKTEHTLIAQALAQSAYPGMDQLRTAIHNDYCRAVATALKANNPNFDEQRFLKECGVTK